MALSDADRMRIQTLREQGLGAKAIKRAYPQKQWSLTTINRLCRKVDATGSVLERKPVSGRQKSARTEENVALVSEMLCSQEDQPGTSLSLGQIAKEVGLCKASVWNIAKRDLGLHCFKRIPVQVITDATRLKRLERSQQLLRRFTAAKSKCIFFTDEKLFYISPPANSQNNRVWNAGRKRDISSKRLLTERAKFSQSVMVSAGVCYGGKGELHFIDEKTKINADYYVNNLLPMLIEDCNQLLPNGCTFQQDGAPAHSSRLAQQFLEQNIADFIRKDEWPPNSPDLNPLDFHVWGAMLDKYQRLQPKPANVTELRAALQAIWNELPQGPINRAILSFRKRLQACVRAEGKHFEHLC